MSNTFKNRVFGCVVIKSVNSNYNADFSHQPRTLPDGSVYATDKALKYTVRNYIDKNYPEDKVFYFKSLNGDMQPRDLDQNYARFFGDYPKADKKEAVKARKVILGNLLSCLDVRLFGGTFASKRQFVYSWCCTTDAWGEPICGRDYLFRADCFVFPELQ